MDKYAMRHSATFAARKRPGVYLIYKKGVLSYVGYSGTDVYKTMYRHFQSMHALKWKLKTAGEIANQMAHGYNFNR